MKTYQDIVKLTREDFNEAGYYTGPFDLSCLFSADVEIDPDLGSIHFYDQQCPESGGLCTDGRIKIGKGTNICVHGTLCANTLITHGEVYCSGPIEVHHLKCKGKLVAEKEIVVTGSFNVQGRVVTPRLVLASLDIQMPQRYHHERNLPKKG